jgi:Ca-activated chloride channel family protein
MRRLCAVLALAALVVAGCMEAASPPKSAAENGGAAEGWEQPTAAKTKLPTDFESIYAAEGESATPAEAAGAEMPAPEPSADQAPADQQAGEFNTESYDRIYENPFLLSRQNPFSTFSSDVDTASYSNVRRFINEGRLPPPGAVRIEELVNYFDYDYAPPEGDAPFSADVEVAACPWNADHRLARIGLKGKVVAEEERPAANLVFLIDVSGSMDQPNKLPLLKSAMQMLVQNLQERDRVAIAVYASASGMVLPPTSCETKGPILAALDRLQAGGSTAGGAGIQLAYSLARQNFIPEHINRVVLCTDGDFNVGITDQSQLVRLIEEQAKSGVYLTVLGFGMGNYKDSTLEKLADKGNGNYGYIDTIHEARKMLVEQLGSTLMTIAKDVKIQVEFNPLRVAAYRLVGYENRMLRTEDFLDDTKDAGEIGAGHTVTALYELVPPGKEGDLPKVEPLRYQQPVEPAPAARSDELFTLKLRFKRPDSNVSEPLAFPVTDSEKTADEASDNFRLAAAVAAFGMLLRESEHRGTASYDMVIALADSAKGDDPSGYRGEFLQLARTAKALAGR